MFHRIIGVTDISYWWQSSGHWCCAGCRWISLFWRGILSQSWIRSHDSKLAVAEHRFETGHIHPGQCCRLLGLHNKKRPLRLGFTLTTSVETWVTFLVGLGTWWPAWSRDTQMQQSRDRPNQSKLLTSPTGPHWLASSLNMHPWWVCRWGTLKTDIITLKMGTEMAPETLETSNHLTWLMSENISLDWVAMKA
jgi:hypothetical protein